MSSVQDKQAEILHNRRIFDKAEVFWSWGGSVAGEKRGQRRIDSYLAYLEPRRGKHFLEYGCGMGWFTQKMGSNGVRITAFDIQREFVDVARGRAAQPDTSFLVTDSEFLPFQADTFDGIYGTSILHHIPMRTTLSEMRRVLKPGGKIIFSEPNMLNPQIMVMKNVRWIGKRMGESPNETAFFKWEIQKLFRENGFQNVCVRPYDFMHPNIPQRLIGHIESLGKFLEKIPLVREIGGSLDIRAVKF